jgi:hypothetical protein
MSELDETRCCSTAIAFAASLDRAEIRVKSCCPANLAMLAQHHSAKRFLPMKGAFCEIRLLLKFSEDFRKRVVTELDGPDAVVASQFLSGEDELLVVCNEERVVFHAWPYIDFD